MEPRRWEQLSQLFEASLEHEPGQRKKFLQEACGDDEALRKEVEGFLLANEEAKSFLETPAIELAARTLAKRPEQTYAGKAIGPYQILSLLGKGGMGDVYSALDTRLNRIDALKILPVELANDAYRLRRFVQEARTASILNHPNIATIYEIGESNGIHWIAQERIEGQTLAERLRGRLLKLDEILDIGIQAASALEEAHGKGIIHRDIKPSNLMITPNGQIKVLDFGLARFARPEIKPVEKKTDSTATISGFAIGTAAYMSPEEVLGQEVDHRSDIFSLGVVLYETATGHSPFIGETTHAIFDSVLHYTPSWSLRARELIPKELQRIISKSLEKFRETRYQSASELRADLQFLKEKLHAERVFYGGFAGTAVRSKNWVRRLIPIGALAVAATMLAWWLARSLPAPKVLSIRQVTRDGWRKGEIFTDGVRLFFREFKNGRWQIAEVSVAGGEILEVPTTFASPILFDVSRYGTELLCGVTNGSGDVPKRSQLWAVPLAGGSPRCLGNLEASYASWSPAGDRIAYCDGRDLHLATNDGIYLGRITSLSGACRWVRWSPDGGKLRFDLADLNKGTVTKWEINVDGSNLHPLFPQWVDTGSESHGDWVADGKAFIFQSWRARATDIFVLRERWNFPGKRQDLTRLTFGPFDFLHPRPSNDGKQIFVRGVQELGQLMQYNLRTKKFEEYFPGISAYNLQSTRDDQWTAYITYPEYSLWRCRGDGGGKKQLTFKPMVVSGFEWSPDGEKIAFHAREPGKFWKIYLIPRDGGAIQSLVPDDRNYLNPTWSPDGNLLAFGETHQDKEPGESQVYLYDFRIKQISTLSGSCGLHTPIWSRDGRYIVMNSVPLKRSVIFDWHTRRYTDLPALEDEDSLWKLSNKGEYLYSLDLLSQNPSIVRMKLSSLKIERLADVKNFHFAWTVFGPAFWIGPGDRLLALRDIGTDEIYSVDLEMR